MTPMHEETPNNVGHLVAACTIIEDLEAASTALLSLKRKNTFIARDVALKVLKERIGDVFYQAFAFEILYSVALDDAVAYIESDADAESTYVLGAMLEAVTEDVGALSSQDKIMEAVSLLKGIIAHRYEEDLRSIAQKRINFEEAYP